MNWRRQPAFSGRILGVTDECALIARPDIRSEGQQTALRQRELTREAWPSIGRGYSDQLNAYHSLAVPEKMLTLTSTLTSLVRYSAQYFLVVSDLILY